MGQSSSNMQASYKEQQNEPPVEGHWVSDIKTGYRWATDPIMSDETIEKKPLGNTISQFEDDKNLKYIWSIPKLPGEVWGPYRKKFTKSIIGGQVFTPPESVDGVPILCCCRDIEKFMRDPKGGAMLQGMGAVAFGKNPPACWNDRQSLWNMTGGMYYYIITRHPLFYEYFMSSKGAFGIIEDIAGGQVGSMRLLHGGTRKRIDKKRNSTKKHKAHKNRN